MKYSYRKPNRFGDILEHTLYLCGKHFRPLAALFLFVFTPLILIEAVLEYIHGRPFFRAETDESGLVERALTAFGDDGLGVSYMPEAWQFIVGSAAFMLFPLAFAAALFAIEKIAAGKPFTAGACLKQALSRFWAVAGSWVAYLLIIAVLFLIALFTLSLIIPGGGFMSGVLLLAGLALTAGLAAVRLSFFFGLTVLEKEGPGFVRSWELSKGRTWITFGIYVSLMFVIVMATFIIEGFTAMFFGSSVIFLVINQIVQAAAYMIFAVGYALMFADLNVRTYGDVYAERWEKDE